jgi:putative tryptophan/tyrosine transport system substrate-binding protein
MLRRREFFALLSGGMASLPQALSAQQKERIAHVGVLMNFSENDDEGNSRATALVQGLQAFGWGDGRNLRISYRWGAGDPELFRRYAQELVTLAPDVILATGTPVVEALQRVTRTAPIVFVTVIDPVGAGFVESLAHPGGNTTGFTLFEYGLSGKWVELLKEVVPPVKRVAVLRDSAIGSGTGQLAAIQAVAPSFGIELSPIGVHDAGEIERSVTAFARIPNGSLIVTASTLALVHRELIISLAARYSLPAVYGDRTFVRAGGLISYGPNRIDPYRRAAEYVDRILRGEKPSDLPVQAPTKYELVVNLKTAQAFNLAMPQSVLTRADEVIE